MKEWKYNIYKLFSTLVLLGVEVDFRKMIDGRLQIISPYGWDIVEIDGVLEFYDGEDAIQGDFAKMLELVAKVGNVK